MADEIYLEPLTTETVKRIIKKERPDSILASLGGQTGLTIAMQLGKEGFLEREGVRLLGTDAAAISRAEDRELFKEAMACGSGACAAVVAAVAGGLCQKGRDITVKAAGGDLTVNYTDDGVTLTGDAKLVYEGFVEY